MGYPQAVAPVDPDILCAGRPLRRTRRKQVTAAGNPRERLRPGEPRAAIHADQRTVNGRRHHDIYGWRVLAHSDRLAQDRNVRHPGRRRCVCGE